MVESANASRADEPRILIVDDDEAVLGVLQRALSTPRAHVATASTGAIALLRLAEESFDVIVSDIQMPGVSGLKLLRAVRNHDLDLPIVLMTGQPDLKGAAEAVEYGAFQYLIKPIEIERLRTVVERAIDLGRVARLKRQCAQEFGSGSFYVGDRAGIDAKLDSALQSLWMAYQPVVRASDGTVFGYEALLRSEEPALPSPGAVLRAATRVARTHDVGRAVRALVAADIQRWPDPSALLFINVHPEDLLDPAFYLASAPLSRVASRVVVELSDRAVMDQVNEVENRIARLRGLGFRVAIDDLGAGHSGPATFTQIEPAFVKLDMTVVRDVHRNKNKANVVRSMVQLCHKMGQSVIAEGVESHPDWETLRTLDCDFGQGYFLGRPSPLSQLASLPSSAK